MNSGLYAGNGWCPAVLTAPAASSTTVGPVFGRYGRTYIVYKRDSPAATNPAPTTDTLVPDMRLTVTLEVSRVVVVNFCNQTKRGTAGNTERYALYDNGVRIWPMTTLATGIHSINSADTVNISNRAKWQAVLTLAGGRHVLDVRQQTAIGTSSLTYGQRLLRVRVLEPVGATAQAVPGNRGIYGMDGQYWLPQTYDAGAYWGTVALEATSDVSVTDSTGPALVDSMTMAFAAPCRTVALLSSFVQATKSAGDAIYKVRDIGNDILPPLSTAFWTCDNAGESSIRLLTVEQALILADGQHAIQLFERSLNGNGTLRVSNRNLVVDLYIPAT